MRESHSVKVIQCVAGTRIDHGGTSRSVPAVCDALNEFGVETHLLVGQPHDTKIVCHFPKDRTRVHRVVEAACFGRLRIGGPFAAKLEAIQLEHGPFSIVHDHGLWLQSNHATARSSLLLHIPRVVSPRGMLSAWSLEHRGLKKKVAWGLFQRADLQSATAFHATSAQEAQEIRQLGFRQPIAVIANGVTLPQELIKKPDRETFDVLFLSRVHPKKGLLMLLDGWKKASLPDHWRLIIAGPDEGGHQREVEVHAANLGLQHKVRFHGDVPDSLKWDLYAEADLFVLPSHSENFGLVIAEALAAGLPVITTTGTPWRILSEQEMGWWIKPDSKSIEIAFRQVLGIQQSNPEQLKLMGQRGSKYVRSNLSWEMVAAKMVRFYEWLLAGNREPVDWIYCD